MTVIGNARARTRSPRLPHHANIPQGILALDDVFARFAMDEEDLDFVASAGLLGDGDGLDAHHAVVFDERSRRPLACISLASPASGQRQVDGASRAFRLGADHAHLARGVEIRRVAMAEGSERSAVHVLALRTVLRYLVWNDQRTLFGAAVLPVRGIAEACALVHTLRSRGAFDRCVAPAVARNPLAGLVDRAHVGHVELPDLLSNVLALGAVAHPSVHVEPDETAVHVLLEFDLANADDFVRKTFVERGGAYKWRELTVGAA